MEKTITIEPPRYGFIPNKLEVEGRPELSDFPLNILFMSFLAVRGVGMSATALYEPDMETYLEDMEKRSMIYRNKYGSENTVTVMRYPDRWEGAKTINGNVVLLANGKTWKDFFVQLTIMGLSKGEKCYYETLKEAEMVN
jgi:hypothetical protein